MEVSAVIGSNYGDEGKGVITDALAFRRPESIIVMTNGGAQRGHTVCAPVKSGNPFHVFHHFGSGTFRGCLTYFPETFLLNPMQFVREYRELSEAYGLGNIRSVRHPRCAFTTPFDMILNQDIEKWRKSKGTPYGTCGMGVWETLFRMQTSIPYGYISLNRFSERPREFQVKWLKGIRDEYCPQRYKQVTGIDWIPDVYVLDDGLIEHFLDDIQFMCRVCPVESQEYETIAQQDGSLIFENGQGLLLDDEYAGNRNSHLSTPSKTGMQNVAMILNTLQDKFGMTIDSLDAYYCSRAYITRHGPGDVLNSTCGDKHSVFGHTDYTNADNEFQGDFRQLPIDQNAQAAIIMKDVGKYLDPIKTSKSKSVVLAYTHLDQKTPEKKLFLDVAECGDCRGVDSVKGLKW